jgi:hypothetical protein
MTERAAQSPWTRGRASVLTSEKAVGLVALVTRTHPPAVNAGSDEPWAGVATQHLGGGLKGVQALVDLSAVVSRNTSGNQLLVP